MGPTSFKRLSENDWLNDEIINNYIKLLKEKFQGARKLLCNTYFYALVEKMDSTKEQDYKKFVRILNKQSVRIQEARGLLLPINIREKHWLLAHFDFESFSIEIIDSYFPLSNEEIEYASTVLRFKAFLERFWQEKTGTAVTFAVVMEQSTPQQTNDNDCGLYVLINMRCILEGKSLNYDNTGETFTTDKRE